jgi:hypothetical protein
VERQSGSNCDKVSQRPEAVRRVEVTPLTRRRGQGKPEQPGYRRTLGGVADKMKRTSGAWQVTLPERGRAVEHCVSL